MSETLFISDCHLDASRPEITRHFVEFIKTRAAKARVLYILGDLFEVWLGDDDPADNLSPIFDVLYSLQKTTKVFFMAGNRDFLIGHGLAKKLNFELLKEPTIITLNSQKTALLHGDSLCTDDVDYQSFRTLVRSKEWQHNFLAKPLAERQQIAKKLRGDSQKATKNKSNLITDVNLNSVLDFYKAQAVTQIIHGHTHRPAIHHYDNNLTRYVLGDWQPNASFIEWNGHSLSLHDPRV